MSTELFGRAADHARDVMASLAPGDLLAPTPCEGWDVARVLLHLADAADGLTGLLETGELVLPEPPRTADADPVRLAQGRLGRLEAALSASRDPALTERASVAGAIELTTHGWDVGVARDPEHRVPEALAADVLALASSVLTDDARGGIFAAPVETPDGASAGDHLVAFLGRSPAA